MTLLLIRHGETAWNAEGRFRGHQDIDLNARGRRQAAALARKLARAYSIDHVHSSPLKRCLNTARPLAKAQSLTVVVEPSLIDLDFGEWEGKLPEEVAGKYPREYAAWLEGNPSFRPPGRDSLRAAADRLQSFTEDIVACHRDETVALVTHEAICQMATCLLLGTSLERFRSIRHETAGVSVFTWNGGAFRAEACNLSLSS